jgi:hypothetical protein
MKQQQEGFHDTSRVQRLATVGGAKIRNSESAARDCSLATTLNAPAVNGSVIVFASTIRLETHRRRTSAVETGRADYAVDLHLLRAV